MPTFPPVGPKGEAPVAYPTDEQVDRDLVSTSVPGRWLGRVAFAGAMLSLTGCGTFVLWQREGGDDTAWGTGLMGDIAGEYWYQVTEDDAWAIVERALQDEGLETQREIRITSGDAVVHARVMQHPVMGHEVLVGFSEGQVEMFRDSADYASTQGSCAVEVDGSACGLSTCGDPATEVDRWCAALGLFPYGEYWSWSEVPEHEAIIEDAAQRFIAWATDNGHLPE